MNTQRLNEIRSPESHAPIEPGVDPPLLGGAGGIGVFGGTFDPFHNAHLAIACAFRDQLALEEVRIIPNGRAPHRAAAGANAEQRLTMCRLGIQHQARMRVDSREIRKKGASFTVESLTEIRSEIQAEQPLYFLLGTDAFQHLPHWFRWRSLFDLANLIIAVRPQSGLTSGSFLEQLDQSLAHQLQQRWTSIAQLRASHGEVALLNLAHSTLSATEIRRNLKERRNSAAWLPARVYAFILDNKLYR